MLCVALRAQALRLRATPVARALVAAAAAELPLTRSQSLPLWPQQQQQRRTLAWYHNAMATATNFAQKKMAGRAEQNYAAMLEDMLGPETWTLQHTLRATERNLDGIMAKVQGVLDKDTKELLQAQIDVLQELVERGVEDPDDLPREEIVALAAEKSLPLEDYFALGVQYRSAKVLQKFLKDRKRKRGRKGLPTTQEQIEKLIMNNPKLRSEHERASIPPNRNKARDGGSSERAHFMRSMGRRKA